MEKKKVVPATVKPQVAESFAYQAPHHNDMVESDMDYFSIQNNRQGHDIGKDESDLLEMQTYL